METYEHLSTFAGQPVIDWDSTEPSVPDVIYRIGLSYEDTEEGERWIDRFAAFLQAVPPEHITGLVVGAWYEMDDASGEIAQIVEALVAASDRLPHLRALFLGDISVEESEISWIVQTDVSPLWSAYPALELFAVRGDTNLQLGRIQHATLKSLTIQSGGLPVEIVRSVLAADLPELRHLELWLGTDAYGGNTTVEDLRPLLAGNLFPNLHTLALRNSEIADDIATALAQAPILERIRVLNLSMGTLGDAGAGALLASPAIARLEKLDIHYHYCSRKMVARLEQLGITVDASDSQKEDKDDGKVYRYVAVSE